MRSTRSKAEIMRQVSALLLVVCFAPGLASGQGNRPAQDPVEMLRQTLRSRTPEPSARAAALRQPIEALTGLSDLKRAICLKEWKDQDSDPQYAEIDRQARRLVEARLEKRVREYLSSSEGGGRLAVIGLIADLGVHVRSCERPRPFASTFASDLALVARQGQPEEQIAALHTLGSVLPEMGIGLPAFAEMLASPQQPVRRAAMHGLVTWLQVAVEASNGQRGMTTVEVSRGDLVALAGVAVPLAGRGLGDADVEIRRGAVSLLNQSAGALRKLVDEGVTLSQLELLGNDGRARASLTSDLLPLIASLRQQAMTMSKALSDSDVEVRLQCRQALESMAHAQLRLLGTTTPQVSRASHQVGSEGDPVLESLRALSQALAYSLNDKDVRSRRAAIDVLESLGDCAAPAMPALANALTDSDRFVRWAAARTIGKIASHDTKTAVASLVKLLDDPDIDLRLAGLSALEKMGAAARQAQPEMIKTLGSTDMEVRIACLRTLAATMPEPGSTAVIAIREKLGDAQPRVRQAAAELLGHMTAAAAESLPDLEKALRDVHPDVSKAAQEAMLRLRR